MDNSNSLKFKLKKSEFKVEKPLISFYKDNVFFQPRISITKKIYDIFIKMLNESKIMHMFIEDAQDNERIYFRRNIYMGSDENAINIANENIRKIRQRILSNMHKTI